MSSLRVISFLGCSAYIIARTFTGMMLLASFLVASATWAQPGPPGRARVALVIGVSAYQHVPVLANPVNDARGVSAALVRLGFDVDTVTNPDRGALEAAIRRIGRRARGAEAAVVFYAGHALEAGGHNWLLPIGTNPATERDLRFEALDLDGVLEQLDGAAPITVVLMDACRDNPFRLRFGGEGRGVAPSGGLAPARAATGTMIVFATAPGTVAQDGAGLDSPFTTALLRHIETPGLEVRQLMANVRRDVRVATGGQQVPWEHSALEGNFFFKPAMSPTYPAATVADHASPGPEAELVFWQGVRDSVDPADLRAFLARFPGGTFAELARGRLDRLEHAVTAPPIMVQLLSLLDHTGDRAAAPYSARWARLDVQRYLAGPPHKAIAVEPASGRLFRWTGLSSLATAEQWAQEGCQESYGGPCVLVASDDNVRPSPGVGQRAPMPRLAYDGAFRPDMVPLTQSEALPDAVRRYSTMTGPKALALRADDRRFTTGTGATPGEAEAAALAECNAAPSPLPCILYASGDRVVLPQRRTEALIPARAAQ